MGGLLAERRSQPRPERVSSDLARLLGAEALGTFALVFFGCGAIMVDAEGGGLGQVGVSLAFGLVVTGDGLRSRRRLGSPHQPGGHARARSRQARFPGQRSRGTGVRRSPARSRLRSCLRWSLGDVVSLGATTPSGSDAQSFVWEALMTATLLVVILAVATDARRRRCRGRSDRRNDRPRIPRRRPDLRRVAEPRALVSGRRSSPESSTRSGSTSPRRCSAASSARFCTARCAAGSPP